MSYENRLPPEGINVSRKNVALEMLSLLFGFGVILVSLAAFLYVAGGFLASYIPFRWEVRLVENFPGLGGGHDDPRSQTLQRMADELVKGIELPEGMSFKVQYVDDDEVNAYATLGGIIRLHRGLLDQLHSENAIGMVLAHEMAHIINRDPAQAMGGRLLVTVVVNSLLGVVGLDGFEGMVGTTSSLTLLSFSREDERQADIMGLRLVGRHYGHMGGVAEVFEKLAAYEAKVGISVPEFMASHPETAARNNVLREEAQKMELPLDGTLTPVPASLRSGRK